MICSICAQLGLDFHLDRRGECIKCGKDRRPVALLVSFAKRASDGTAKLFLVDLANALQAHPPIQDSMLLLAKWRVEDITRRIFFERS